MLTLTAARDCRRTRVLMNAVDTGWVTDMAPGGLGAAARAHETFVGPPLDDEVRGRTAAAARGSRARR